MALIPNVGQKTFKMRSFIAFVYIALILLGSTMVVPFLITVSSSATNDMDYHRYSPVPRYLYSSSDRFMKGLVYFFNEFRGWNAQLRANMPEMPTYWTSWSSIGKDIQQIDKLADQYYNPTPEQFEKWKVAAADYSKFCDSYPLIDTSVTVINPQGVNYMEESYIDRYSKANPEEAAKLSWRQKKEKALELLNQTWGIPFESFFNVQFRYETGAPLDFQTYFPPALNPKYKDFLRLKGAYRSQYFTPGVKESWLAYLEKKAYKYEKIYEVFPVYNDAPEALRTLWGEFKSQDAPASPTIPYALRTAWYKFLKSEDAAKFLKLPKNEKFSVDTYNKICKTDYKFLEHTPFPVPASFSPKMISLWQKYVTERYPLRLTTIKVTPALEKQFQAGLKKDIKHIRIANELLKTNNTSWSQFKLLPNAPLGGDKKSKNYRNVWMSFAKKLTPAQRKLSCSEMAFQQFLLKKYKTVDAVNQAYGWNIKLIEEAFPPFMAAYAVTLKNHETAFTFKPVFYNYKVIADYLLLNARAVPVTFLLIVMTIIFTLTVNPLAAYSLSRFNLKGQDKILLFMLATMAFPAMVSAIPAYLLMRDLNLLNTFWALVLPSAANGMAIFILKGFFDSLPQELFEAATIDGASEMQIFRIVAMPMVKPILAINCLNAFIIAYNGWQWALIICQDKKMWTIAVWLYQASMWWSSMPWLVSAGFVVASIPTFVVFVSCQKIILRGIIIPSMK